MANREFNIPFGPDRTNGAGFAPLEPIAPENEQADEALADPFAEPPIERYANTSSQQMQTQQVQQAGRAQRARQADAYPTVEPISFDEPELEPELEPDFAPEPASAPETARTSARSAESKTAANSTDSAAAPARASRRDRSADVTPRTLTDEEATEQGMDAMQMSFIALKDSIGQGRELKARESELDELSAALEEDYEELADRENILANYHALVAEQDAIINQRTQQRDARKAELAQVSAQTDETREALDRMREYHATEMQPLETELGRVRAQAEQAKNDERSRKSELNAAETELRRADETEANTMAVSKHQQVSAAYEDARRRSEQAKEQLEQVQKMYDDARQQIEQAEGPLERSLADLEHRAEELKEAVNRLAEDISKAQHRRQYCDTVYQYPEETARMRAEIEAAETHARQMDAENAALREQLTESKQKARKAKLAIAGVIAIIIVFIVVLIIVSTR